MDELKHRAEEKIGALHEAAKIAANSSKNKAQDIVHTTTQAILRIRDAFQELWNHELIAQSRDRAAAWGREAAQRIREGALPLSPAVLYQELVALFKDHMWRRSMIIFVCGAMVGGSAGVIIGMRAASRVPAGPHARALHTQSDQTVILVEDAVAPGAGAGEVLVRVQAFSVCPADRGVLRGRASALRSLITRSPVTVGRGFAGVVLDVGVGVGELEMGDEVWGCVSEWAGGAASELLVIRSTRVSKRPRSLAADAAASLPYAGALALRAVERLRYGPNNCRGKRVAIVGASSGEGSAILQLLSSWGARVTAAAPRALAPALKKMGAHEVVEMEGAAHAAASWLQLEAAASRAGPWDAVLACAGPGAPPAPPPPPTVLLKATAPRSALVELRPRPLLTDRLPLPLWVVFTASFYTVRALRWMVGCGTHTDWLEERHQLSAGLDSVRLLVDAGHLYPVLDKVYLPQDFESALAHACSDDAVGTTVIRFP